MKIQRKNIGLKLFENDESTFKSKAYTELQIKLLKVAKERAKSLITKETEKYLTLDVLENVNYEDFSPSFNNKINKIKEKLYYFLIEDYRNSWDDKEIDLTFAANNAKRNYK